MSVYLNSPVVSGPIWDRASEPAQPPFEIPLKYSDSLIDSYISDENRARLNTQQRADRKEVLRRIEPEERAKWLASTTNLRCLDWNELYALQSVQWAHPIFKDPELETHALFSFISGHIDKWILSEILIYCDLRGKGEAYPLFLGSNNPNQNIVLLLNTNLKDYFEPDEIQSFWNEVAQLPPNRTHLYLTPIKEDLLDKNVVDGIVKLDHKLLVFSMNNAIGTKCQAVLSPYLINLLYKTRGKEADPSCSLNPVLGRSVSGKNFMNPLQRDVLIPCSLFPQSTPDRADGFSASPIEFYHHDAVYHTFLETTIPFAHRKAFIELAQLFKSDNPCYNKFLDREFRFYYAFRNHSKLEYIFINSFLYKIKRDQDLQTVISHMYQNRDRWIANYGIDVRNLRHSLERHEFSPNAERILSIEETIHDVVQNGKTELDLSHNANLIREAHLAQLSHAPLTNLNLSGCKLITPKSFDYLLRMPLERLDLSHCDFVSMDSEQVLDFAEKLWKKRECEIMMPSGVKMTSSLSPRRSFIYKTWKWLQPSLENRVLFAAGLGTIGAVAISYLK